MSRKPLRLATLDIETDPFLHGRVPQPFAVGFYDGETYHETWGDDCIADMIEYLDQLPPHIIYAHNGGRFDWLYFEHALDNPVAMIDGRLVKARLGKHRLRDSLKIIPVALNAYEKDTIDYALFERGQRDKPKTRAKISNYLMHDCMYLYNLVHAFRDRFGNALTIGSAAMTELKKDYEITTITAARDAEYRPYFHGGRCEAFRIGECPGPWHVYDVNSMYPHVMAACAHPVGVADYYDNALPTSAPFYIARIRCTSRGALPVRTKDGLSFPHGSIETWCTSHEINAARELELIDTIEPIECHVWDHVTNFKRFVQRFNAEKIAAEETGDKIGRLFAKLIMNNAYGKFAQNPERFRDYFIADSVDELIESDYKHCADIGSRVIGEKPARIFGPAYFNVACGASITGAARALLLRALASAVEPIYCDTDSIIARSIQAPIHATQLGAWKHEATLDRIYIAGKKLYAGYAGDDCIKHASKGVNAKPEEIVRIAKGDVLSLPREAPSLRLGQPPRFITRTIRSEQLRAQKKAGKLRRSQSGDMSKSTQP